MTYDAAADRYEQVAYRRLGRSGLEIPPISLGLWQNFGEEKPFAVQREILHAAFDNGVTHFDLANNYGTPFGSAERNFGTHLSESFRRYRDELVISTKAGYDMWPGPYGDRGSRKYLLASLDQSLGRMGLDYVDIFYSHRPDPATPVSETIGALRTAVESGRALYVGISNYDAEQTRAALAAADEIGLTLLVHQPQYSMLNRWVEDGLLDVVGEAGLGCIAFSPLAQGQLTDRYLQGTPRDSRAARGVTLRSVPEETLAKVRALDRIAREGGRTLAQLALVWVLRDARVTSALVGASSVEQLQANLAAASDLTLDADELAAIEAVLAR